MFIFHCKSFVICRSLQAAFFKSKMVAKLILMVLLKIDS